MNLYVDDQLAYSVRPESSIGISFFSCRVRSFSGQVKAEVIRTDGSKIFKQVRIKHKQGKDSYIPNVEDHNKEFIEKSEPGSIKALFQNYMGAKNYIDSISIDTSGGRFIQLTPYASMNPFIWVKGYFSNAHIQDVILAIQEDDALPPTEQARTPDVVTVSTGTGWLSGYGVFVTNHHVIDGASDIYIIKSDGTPVQVIVSADDAENDLALLSPLDRKQISNLSGIPLAGHSVSIGADVFTIGYPVIGLLGKAPKLTDGVVSATSGIGDDPRYYQITVPLQPGNSGGPLINKYGEVIGVVSSSINSQFMAKKTGSLPQNINYAVKSDYIRPLASNALNALPVNELPSSKMDMEDLARRIVNSVVLIVAK